MDERNDEEDVDIFAICSVDAAGMRVTDAGTMRSFDLFGFERFKLDRSGEAD